MTVQVFCFNSQCVWHMCMLNHCLEWDKWVLSELIHSGQLFNTLIPWSRMVGSVAYTLFVWSRLSAPMELSTRYTTPDTTVEIGSTSATNSIIEHVSVGISYLCICEERSLFLVGQFVLSIVTAPLLPLLPFLHELIIWFSWLSAIICPGLTHSEIIAQGILLFLAGFETTANTMSLLAYHLAVNNDCQDKLIQEIDNMMKGQVLDYWQLLPCCFYAFSNVLQLECYVLGLLCVCSCIPDVVDTISWKA